jgi:cell division protease FtsH
MIRLSLKETNQIKLAMNSKKPGNSFNQLQNLKNHLQNTFPHMYPAIDAIIPALSGWYSEGNPQGRPIVINLWGHTGVGKTSLVREIIDYLQLQDIFFELDNDARNFQKLAQKIEHLSYLYSTIKAVFLVDNFQDLIYSQKSNHPFNDSKNFWSLIGEGTLEKERSALESETILNIYREFSGWVQKGLKVNQGLVSEDFVEFFKERGIPVTMPKKRSIHEQDLIENESNLFVFNRYETKVIFRSHLHEFGTYRELIEYLKTLDEMGLMKFLNSLVRKAIEPERIDISNSIFFVLGNLKGLFPFEDDVSNSLDPDAFYFSSLKIGPHAIQKILLQNLEIDKVSRLGSNHIMVPCLSSRAFSRIMDKELEAFEQRFKIEMGIAVSFEDSVRQLLFMEGVIPALGAWSILSAFQRIIVGSIPFIESSLTMFKAIDQIELAFDGRALELRFFKKGKRIFRGFNPLKLNVISKLQLNPTNVQASTALHEAGHALIYCSAFGEIPSEVQSASNDREKLGNLQSEFSFDFMNRNRLKKLVMTYLGGYLAEKIILGEDYIQESSKTDLESASHEVLTFFTEYGFGGTPLFFGDENQHSKNHFPVTEEIYQKAASFIEEATKATEMILKEEEKLLLQITKALMEEPVLERNELSEIIEKYASEKLIQRLGSTEKGVREILLEKIEANSGL